MDAANECGTLTFWNPSEDVLDKRELQERVNEAGDLLKVLVLLHYGMDAKKLSERTLRLQRYGFEEEQALLLAEFYEGYKQRHTAEGRAEMQLAYESMLDLLQTVA